MTSKKAKCGIHSKCFCDTKHDSPQCDECILVKHRKEPLYIFKNGHRLKRCARCGEYKPMNEFYLTNNRYYSWCKDCGNSYAREYSKRCRKHYTIGHKEHGKKTFITVDSPTKMLKLVRKYIIEGNETLIEIKCHKQ